MSPKRMFFVMLGLLVLIAGLGVATLVVGNNMLQKKSQKLVSLKLENKVLEEQQVALKKAKADVAKNAELEKIAKAVVPQDKDQARAVREIVQIAQDAGIKLKSITFPSSNLGTAVVVTPSGGSTTPSAPVSSPVSQAKPVEGISGVLGLEMSIAPDDTSPVSYKQFLDFLTRLENNRRTAQVTQIKIDPKGNNIMFALTINIFIKP